MDVIIRSIVGFAVLSCVFAVVERIGRRPGERQRPSRRAVRTDVAWWFFVGTVGRWLVQAAVVVVVVLAAVPFVRPLEGEAIRAWVTRPTVLPHQPALLQALEVVVLVDFLGYWLHRGFHRFGPAWRVHAVHHSSTRLTWLSAVRVHPINDAVPNMVGAAVLVVAGFDATTLAVAVPFFTLYAITVHADVGWTYGPLRHVVASPVFHRWHHTAAARGGEKNFASTFPVLDMMFGSFYMPKDKLPDAYGVSDPMPPSFMGQMAYPFRRSDSEAAPVRPSEAPTSAG